MSEEKGMEKGLKQIRGRGWGRGERDCHLEEGLTGGRGGGKGGIVEEGIGEIVNISAGPLSVEGKEEP